MIWEDNGAKVDMDNVRYGTIIRVCNKDRSERMTGLVLKNGNVRVLRYNETTCSGNTNLGEYNSVSQLVYSIDKSWRVEVAIPGEKTRFWVDEPNVATQTQTKPQPVAPRPAAGSLVRAFDNNYTHDLAISAVVLTNGNVLLVSYGDLPCTEFITQYEYTMSQFMHAYKIKNEDLIIE